MGKKSTRNIINVPTDGKPGNYFMQIASNNAYLEYEYYLFVENCSDSEFVEMFSHIVWSYPIGLLD